MNIATDAPKRPALRYYGGKWNLAPWIISHFPPHKNYVEPCGGAASVLLQKPRSPLETYNDLDGNVVNFFRVLRDKPDELIQKIKLTPWAREEFDNAKRMDGCPVERARKMVIVSWMGTNGGTNLDNSGLNFRTQVNGVSRCGDISSNALYEIACRLQNVQIEKLPVIECICKYDGVDSLIYVDPPYISETRTDSSVYAFEWNEENHVNAAELLRNAKGFVVVSGYACPLYTDIYESHGWRRVDKESQTNSGGKRIESLWLSPRTWNALQNDYSDLGLFAST